MRRGEVWWAALRPPRGSELGHKRPVLIVQADSFNRSNIRTAIAVVLTSNVDLAKAPGNVLLSRRATGLPRRSVVNVSQIVTLDEEFLLERVRQVPETELATVDSGLRLVLGL